MTRLLIIWMIADKYTTAGKYNFKSEEQLVVNSTLPILILLLQPLSPPYYPRHLYRITYHVDLLNTASVVAEIRNKKTDTSLMRFQLKSKESANTYQNLWVLTN